MLRIIHFSDFHLNKKALEDWNYFLKNSLLKELKAVNEEKSIDLILLTGDLIDKGGKSFNSIKEAFRLFKENIIDPIIIDLNFPIERFLVVPGNHDLYKNAEEEWEDIGLRAYFNNQDNIQSFIRKGRGGDYKGFERVKPFKEFEKELYFDVVDCQLSCFDSNFIMNINEMKIGISCLNSSWRCYDSTKDKGLVIVGDTQIASANLFLKDCDLKIALIHHPYDWINEVEQKVIHSHLHSHFNLMFIGHVHEGDTSLETNFAGSLFTSIAPSSLSDIRSDSRRYSNGFTIVDYKKNEKKVECLFKRYNHEKSSFVLNSDKGENGLMIFDIPPQGRLKQIKSAQDHLKTIIDVRFDEMDEHLISRGTDFGPKTIKEAFILPNISQTLIENKQKGIAEVNYLSLNKILNIENDLLFFGGKESSKTIFLFRLVHEFVERFEFKKIVPVYLDFLEIGNREIESCLKSYLSCSKDDLESLLENRDIILLVDNIQWNQKEFSPQIKKLTKFREKNSANKKGKRIKLLATGQCEIVGVVPADFDMPSFDFEIYFIKNLQTKQIKSLISKLVPLKNTDDVDKRLKQIVDNFKSFALPRTAMSVSLFVWSMENKDRKPINNATLLDIFLEIILEKIQGDEIYREKFDVDDKMMLLSYIAEKMLICKSENYCLEYSDLVQTVNDYLTKEVGFDFDTQKIVDYFMNRKIFMKYQKNKIKFSYSCFFQFFLAKRMIYNSEFKEYILNEERYHHYIHEIDYYTGLFRSDKSLLNDLFKRFKKEFAPYQEVLHNVNIDTHFNTEKPIIKDVTIDKIKNSRPTKDQLEKLTDQFLEKLPNPEIILSKEQRKTLELILVLIAKVFRNSEGVEDLSLKKEIYEEIVKDSLIFILLYQFVMIEYYRKYKTLPPNVPKEYDLATFLRNIPLHVQLGMSSHLASVKIAPIVLNKIMKDNDKESITGTDIEKFLSVFLYSDIQGQNYPKYLRKFVKSVKNNAVMDYCLYKLWNYSFTRGKPGSSNEEIFLDLLSTLKLKTESLPKRMRDEVLRILKTKNQEDNITEQ